MSKWFGVGCVYFVQQAYATAKFVHVGFTLFNNQTYATAKFVHAGRSHLDGLPSYVDPLS